MKWTLRSAQTRRSIFQAQEGEDADIQAILGREPATTADSESDTAGVETLEAAPAVADNHTSGRRLQGVVETYFTSTDRSAYPGLNFAVATSPSDRVELIFAGPVSG